MKSLLLFFLLFLFNQNIWTQDSLDGPLSSGSEDSQEAEDDEMDKEVAEDEEDFEEEDFEEEETESDENFEEEPEEQKPKKRKRKRINKKSERYRKKYKRFYHRAVNSGKTPLSISYHYSISKSDIEGLDESAGISQLELTYQKVMSSENSFVAGLNYSFMQESGLEFKALYLILGHQTQINQSRIRKFHFNTLVLIAPYSISTATSTNIEVKDEASQSFGLKLMVTYSHQFSLSQAFLMFAGYQALYFNNLKNSSNATGADESINYIMSGPVLGAGYRFFF